MNTIIDGKKFSKNLQEKLNERINANNLTPALIIGMIGDNPASETYVRNKKTMCEKVGILPIIIHLDEDVSSNHLEEVLRSTIQSLKDSHQIGLMVQLPVPSHINLDFLENDEFSKYDVEGVTKNRLKHLYTSKSKDEDENLLAPCTARGIRDLLIENKISIEGETVLMIGRSNIVGAPLSKLLTNANATVINVHSRTPKEKLIELANISDVVIVSVGIPNIFGKEIAHDGMTIVDVGIHRKLDGKLTGDVNMSEILATYDNINYTPVPGGVGPTTVIELMKSMVILAEEQYVDK